MHVLGVRRSMAYRRVAACVHRGLLERLDLVRAEPTLLRATLPGLRYAGLGLEPSIVSPGSINHWLACASTALALADEAGLNQVVSDRELRLFERIEGKPIASATMGEHPDGSPALHRPDLAIIVEKLPIAIEVELTPKAPQRLLRRPCGRRLLSALAIDLPLCSVVSMGSLDPLNGSGRVDAGSQPIGPSPGHELVREVGTLLKRAAKGTPKKAKG
jgi:hypothetical protein